MRRIHAASTIAAAIALLLSSCAGVSDSASPPIESAPAQSTVEPTIAPVAAEPESPTPPLTVRAEPVEADPTPARQSTPEPEPSAVYAASEPEGSFVCASQEPSDLAEDGQLAADLEPLLGPGVPGLVAATASSDGLLRIGSAGLRTVDGDDPMLSSDRMHLGSDTKAMTGTLLALLAEQGEIGLTTLVSDIWADADDGWDGVTLLDLLHHRGGAEDNLGRDQADLWSQLWQSSIATHPGTRAERAAAAQAERARFATALTSAAPSEVVGQFAYSNSGYMLVGAAIEARLGVSWEDLMCEHLFRPLRMDGCGFGPPAAPGPQGHTGAAGSLVASNPGSPSADNPFALGPAGTVYCPVADWARYLSWVLRGARGEDERLSPEAWDMLLQPEGDYAAGWLVTSRPWASGPIYTHAGSNTMWFAVTWLAPGIDRAFMIVSNAATPQAQAATDQGIGLLVEAES